MLNIRRILIPIDFSEHCQRALAYGREIAIQHEAQLDLLHVIDEPTFPSFYKVGEEALYGEVESLQERTRAALQECMDEASGPVLEDGIAFHIEKGKPADKIIEVAKEIDVDLIIISTHGLSGVERVLMGSVADQVIRNAACPVFVVKSFGKSLLPAS